MFKSRQNRNHKPIKKMNVERHIEVMSAYTRAIFESDYNQARDLVTKMQSPSGRKIAYSQLLLLACQNGNIFQMMEVAPFCGFQISEEEIRNCLRQALNNGDLRNVVQCKKFLGEKILIEELKFLRESLGESIIPGYQNSKSYLIEFIRSRLGDTLTPEEVLRLRYIEIQIDRSDSD